MLTADVAILLKRLRIVRQTNTHEVPRKRLGQMFAVGGKQAQARANGLCIFL